jgi:hypothetical protein
MTEGLKILLQHYGALSVTLAYLLRERPGESHSSLEEYYKELGAPLPDEPVLAVKISKDGETRFIHEPEHNVEFRNDTGEKVGSVTVLELPEDEYWFFSAFRPSLFDLNKDLPPFMYEMAIVNAYAMLEGYISDLLRVQLRRHPQLMGGQRELKYEQILAAASKEELLALMIEREIRDTMYLPFVGIIKKMREQLGFRHLTRKYDEAVTRISYIRNCLLHNNSRADAKFAAVCPTIREGEKFLLEMKDVTETIDTLRQLASAIDAALE